MNALSQISQISQLACEIGDKALPFLQTCIDALKTEKENERLMEEFRGNPLNNPEIAECVSCPPKCKKEGCNRLATKKNENSDCFGECWCEGCSHNYFWNLCDLCFAEECPDCVDSGDEEMVECVGCEECFRKCDLVEAEDEYGELEGFYCDSCWDHTFITCECCCEPVRSEDGEWVSMRHSQPFLKSEVIMEYCWDCFRFQTIGDNMPQYKTDTITFQAEGDLRKEDLAEYVEKHTKMVAEMKWCVRCDLEPQSGKNDKNWCSECYFQHGADDDESDDEEDRAVEECCGKPLYDMLLNYKEGTFCECFGDNCECCGEPATAGLHDGKFVCIPCREGWGEEKEEKEEVCGSCCATKEKHNDELCDWC